LYLVKGDNRKIHALYITEMKSKLSTPFNISVDFLFPVELDRFITISNNDSNAMYIVIPKCRNHNLSTDCQVDLFDRAVKHIPLYSCEI
jgi:hypothetical protein